MSDSQVTLILPQEQVEALARRVAALIEEGRDDGFLDVEDAAKFLAVTPAAVRRKVERRTIPHHRAGGRVLFDRRELRAWVEEGRC
jgi:excisionase family DNA binding protein